jgi:hypothetical protein
MLRFHIDVVGASLPLQVAQAGNQEEGRLWYGSCRRRRKPSRGYEQGAMPAVDRAEA